MRVIRQLMNISDNLYRSAIKLYAQVQSKKVNKLQMQKTIFSINLTLITIHV